MANLGQYQDPTDGALADERTALPAGEYQAAIVKSDEKQNKAGTGSYINLEFEVQDGEHQGRRFWEILNLNNKSQEAVEIANRALNSICHACGKLRSSVSNSEDLHGIPMLITLGQVTDDYGTKNKVKAYKPMNGNSGQTGASDGGTGGKPWGNRAA